MKRSNKKGFTIVELVIVIAIIAILAAVLIPTFSNVIKKANESSDIQAMRNMNTYLAVEDASKGSMDIKDVYTVLKAHGLNAKDYKPLYDGRLYFYDQDDNRIVYTDMDYKVLFGENEGKTKAELGHTWLSLSGEIGMKTVTVTDGVATISTAEEFYYLFSEPECRGAKNITITDNIDAMGANVEMNYAANSGEITIDGQNNSISNAIQNTYKEVGTGVNEGKVYKSGFIPTVHTGTSLTLQNLTFDGCIFGDPNTGMVGIIGGMEKGANVAFKNVTIQNCEFYGKNKVGAFVGAMQGDANGSGSNSKLEIDSACKIKDTNIFATEGECGKLVGAIYNSRNSVTISSNVVENMTNVNLKLIESEGRTVYRGTVTLVNANSSNATQEMLNNLTGVVKSGSSYRPFSENALYSSFIYQSDDANISTVNNVKLIGLSNGTTYAITVSVPGVEENITLSTKCWYVATALPQE